MKIGIKNDKIRILYLKSRLPKYIAQELIHLKEITQYTGAGFLYEVPLLGYSSFILYHLINSQKEQVEITEQDYLTIQEVAKETQMPIIDVNNTHILIKCPAIPEYKMFTESLSASNRQICLYTVPIARMYEVIRYANVWRHSFLPQFKLTDEFIDVASIELANSVNELTQTEVTELVSIAKGWKINPEGFKKRLKCNNLMDLLLYMPKGYTDRTKVYSILNAPIGKHVFIDATITNVYQTGKHLVINVISDSTMADVRLWGQAFMKNSYKKGDDILVYGLVDKNRRLHSYSITQKHEARALPISPIYKLSPTYNITNKILVNSITEAIFRLGSKRLGLAKYIDKNKYLSFGEALRELHLPTGEETYIKAMKSLAYYELVYLQLILLDKKKNEVKASGIAKKYKKDGMYDTAIKMLPFNLTTGQVSALEHITEKLSTPLSEKMMLSGDVGCGKTLVATLSCLRAVDGGTQAALIGPTEVLAKQLYNNVVKFSENLPNRPVVAYLSGATKAKEKTEIKQLLKAGQIDIIVGTHALLSDSVEYENLGLYVIDEEQKFGAQQREYLLKKTNTNGAPDVLSQTATPIPRSTAQALYGDIDLITIETKPEGRKEIETVWIQESAEKLLQSIVHPLWTDIFKEIEQKHQIFFVAPMVVDNDKISAASVEATQKILTKKFGKNLKIDTLHGGISKEEQNKKIDKFRNGETDVLIASTIIEVGVDIPNATRMIVLSADRFGASSLHQIRGRVGRSALESKCYLVSEKKTGSTQKRLQSLVDSNNGFEIALVDLETRKEGDIFGVKQSGDNTLKFFNINEDLYMLPDAKKEAERIYNSKDKELALLDAKTLLLSKEE